MKKQKTSYACVKGDEVDEAIGEVLSKFDFELPVIRIANGKYLIGTESKMVMIKGNSCMVRVGGGFEKLDGYISRN